MLVVGALAGGCGDGGGDEGATGGSDDGAPSAAMEGHEHHGDEAPAPAFAEGEATTRVDAVLRDYAFGGVPADVRGPRVWFAATIQGSNTHELDVLDAGGRSVGVIPPFVKKDGVQTLAVELPPGTYTLQCLVEEGARTHADLGMRQTITVG